MESMIDSEIEALKSIYCRENEFQLLSRNEQETILAIQLQLEKCPLQLTFTLDQNYPGKRPQISIQCTEWSRRKTDDLITELSREADKRCGEPMLLFLLQWLMDQMENDDSPESNVQQVIQQSRMSLLIHLDHIRCQNMYVKTITQWCQDMHVNGSLLLFRRWIFLVLSGFKPDLQSYVKLHRTQCVDLDSSGRPCKERYLTILCEIADEIHLPDGFHVIECNESSDLRNYFIQQKSVNIYEQFIQPLIKGPKYNIQT